MTTRRQFVALGALAAAPAIVRSQPAWPTRPVRLFVGSSAGGSVDIPTRNLAARLSQRFGQQFIVENRAGAGGVIAAQAVVKSDPDGYTWLSSGPAELFNSYYLWQNAGREFPYNPMKDLIPAALIQRGAGVLVVPAVLGVRNWAELLKRAKEAMAAGQFGQAANDFQLVVSMDPGHREAAELAAEALMEGDAAARVAGFLRRRRGGR